jgi:hypothetical protein
MGKEIAAEAALENCRALIDQIIAELSTKEPFVNTSSRAEVLLFLELAASLLPKGDDACGSHSPNLSPAALSLPN